MNKRRKSTYYNPNTYKIYGSTPYGNYYLQLAMGNDRGLYDYVKRNNKTLAKLPKDEAIKRIKSRASESWSIQDLRKVNGKNVKSSDLKWYLRNFNE